jgi:hypothetical protein
MSVISLKILNRKEAKKQRDQENALVYLGVLGDCE